MLFVTIRRRHKPVRSLSAEGAGLPAGKIPVVRKEQGVAASGVSVVYALLSSYAVMDKG